MNPSRTTPPAPGPASGSRRRAVTLEAASAGPASGSPGRRAGTRSTVCGGSDAASSQRRAARRDAGPLEPRPPTSRSGRCRGLQRREADDRRSAASCSTATSPASAGSTGRAPAVFSATCCSTGPATTRWRSRPPPRRPAASCSSTWCTRSDSVRPRALLPQAGDLRRGETPRGRHRPGCPVRHSPRALSSIEDYPDQASMASKPATRPGSTSGSGSGSTTGRPVPAPCSGPLRGDRRMRRGSTTMAGPGGQRRPPPATRAPHP